MMEPRESLRAALAASLESGWSQDAWSALADVPQATVSRFVQAKGDILASAFTRLQHAVRVWQECGCPVRADGGAQDFQDALARARWWRTGGAADGGLPPLLALCYAGDASGVMSGGPDSMTGGGAPEFPAAGSAFDSSDLTHDELAAACVAESLVLQGEPDWQDMFANAAVADARLRWFLGRQVGPGQAPAILRLNPGGLWAGGACLVSSRHFDVVANQWRALVDAPADARVRGVLAPL